MNCHNGASFLKESIQSVFNQTFSDWEIIFFNNYSTDNSEEIAHSFGNKVKVFNSRKLLNLGHARAEALNLSNGEWITFLDTDDLWMEKKLEIQLEEIEGSDFALGYSGVQRLIKWVKLLENKFQNIILDIYLTINFKILKLIWLLQ